MITLVSDRCSAGLRGNLLFPVFLLEWAANLLFQTECNDMVTFVQIFYIYMCECVYIYMSL